MNDHDTDYTTMRQTIDEISEMMLIGGTIQERCERIRGVFRAVAGIMPQVLSDMDRITKKK